jgi:WD40 repeat protein
MPARNPGRKKNFDKELSSWPQLPKAEEIWGAELQILEGHSKPVWSATFSPDGGLLASGSIDETIKLWDLSTDELRQTLVGHSSWVWSEKMVDVSIKDHQWICLQGKSILWLPSEYRETCLALNGSLLALSHANGRISFISYDHMLLNECI